MSTVLLTCHHVLRNAEKVVPILEEQGVEVHCPPIAGQQFDADEMTALLDGIDVVIAGDDVIDRSVLAAGKAKGLKAVIRWGIGTDSVDKKAAAELGIAVYNTPGVFSNEVADLAFTYLLMLCRPLHRMDRSVREGDWRPVSGRTLAGLSVGIVGLGAIGRAIGRRCAGFGMTARGYDPVQIPEADLVAAGVEQVSFDALLETSDIVIVACALTPENRHLLGREAFGRIKPGALVINVGRGPLIDEAALVEALESGRVAGAGLDVFEVEPLPMESPLRRFDTCIFGCHAGSNTVQAVDRVNRMTAMMALQILGIDPPERQPLNRVA